MHLKIWLYFHPAVLGSIIHLSLLDKSSVPLRIPAGTEAISSQKSFPGWFALWGKLQHELGQAAPWPPLPQLPESQSTEVPSQDKLLPAKQPSSDKTVTSLGWTRSTRSQHKHLRCLSTALPSQPPREAVQVTVLALGGQRWPRGKSKDRATGRITETRDLEVPWYKKHLFFFFFLNMWFHEYFESCDTICSSCMHSINIPSCFWRLDLTVNQNKLHWYALCI